MPKIMAKFERDQPLWGRQMHEKYEKNITLRYLLIVVVIKYSLPNPRWRKPEVEVLQNRQFIPTFIYVIYIVKGRQFCEGRK